jgi:hypothetical protein
VYATQDFELDFLSETSKFLEWGYEAQFGLGTLPPYRFKISKRDQQVPAANPNQQSLGESQHMFGCRTEVCHILATFREAFCLATNEKAGLPIRPAKSGGCDPAAPTTFPKSCSAPIPAANHQ